MMLLLIEKVGMLEQYCNKERETRKNAGWVVIFVQSLYKIS
jgi:hypothetical protein